MVDQLDSALKHIADNAAHPNPGTLHHTLLYTIAHLFHNTDNKLGSFIWGQSFESSESSGDHPKPSLSPLQALLASTEHQNNLNMFLDSKSRSDGLTPQLSSFLKQFDGRLAKTMKDCLKFLSNSSQITALLNSDDIRVIRQCIQETFYEQVIVNLVSSFQKRLNPKREQVQEERQSNSDFIDPTNPNQTSVAGSQTLSQHLRQSTFKLIDLKFRLD